MKINTVFIIKGRDNAMEKRYIVTGAAGHLGTALLHKLEGQEAEVFALVLPGQTCEERANIHYIEGDVCQPDSLRPLFESEEGRELYMIHAAGMIDISEKGSPKLFDVNIKGTENVIELCREYKVKRLVYVSSVHAIPEKKDCLVMKEVDEFSPDTVVGAYAQTKAAATQAVLEAGKQGMDVVVVHPSGIIGPYDRSGNHLVQMITDYLRGALPACVRGGYDFVDVRDVAEGCLLAMEKGKSGNCYILSNRHYEIRDLLGMVRSISRGRKLAVLPMWMAKAFAPLMQQIAKWKKQRPLYTTYSLYTLCSNDRFSHDKATHELGYMPRDLHETLRDTVLWYQSQKVGVAR